MLEVWELKEINPIQGTQSIKPIVNNESIDLSALKKQPSEVQLHYDEAEEITKSDIEKSVNKMNEHIVGINAQLQYRIHEGTDRIMVKLVDTESNEVIREIPPEKMLDLVAGIWERVGLVIDNLE